MLTLAFIYPNYFWQPHYSPPQLIIFIVNSTQFELILYRSHVLILEADGKLCPIEIKKTASPASQLTNVFKTLDRANIESGNGAVLCMKDELMAFDSQNYIIPVWLI